MKKIAIGIVAIVALIGTPALAADMPVKAPPQPPAPAYSWTGFYVGLNTGVGFGNANANWSYVASSAFPEPAGCPPGGFDTCTSGSDRANMSGVIGGVQVGYNWRSGNILAGIEADFQGTSQSGTRDVTTNWTCICSIGAGANQGSTAVSITERMPWLGTVRGRIGTITGQWLLYATGGLAYGRVEADSSGSITGINIAASTNGFNPAWSTSDNGMTKAGWTIGAGAELALDGNWSAKFEYLFVDLGSFNTTFPGISGCFGVIVGGGAACITDLPGAANISSRITDNIVRLGLNYKFN